MHVIAGLVNTDAKDIPTAPSEIYWRWVDVVGGQLLGAAKREDPQQACFAGMPGREGPWMAIGKDKQGVYAYFDRTDAQQPVKFSAPFDASVGLLPGDTWLWDVSPPAVLKGGGPKLLHFVFDAKTIDSLDAAGSPVWGEAQGHLAFWTVPSQMRLVTWSDDGKGPRVVADNLPLPPQRAVVSDTHLVALLYDSSLSGEVRLWRSPRALEPKDVQPAISPLPALSGWELDNLRTWGDFAAMTASRSLANGPLADWEQAVMVVKLSTQQVWRLSATKGKWLPELTVSPTHLFVTEAEWPNDIASAARRILRYELGKIDSWAKPL